MSNVCLWHIADANISSFFRYEREAGVRSYPIVEEFANEAVYSFAGSRSVIYSIMQ